VKDRALRYRANAHPPPGARICCLCGATRNVEIGYVDGLEENTAPENLFWTCRSCNVRSALALKRAGIGRRTGQFNPAAAGARKPRPMADGSHQHERRKCRYVSAGCGGDDPRHPARHALGIRPRDLGTPAAPSRSVSTEILSFGSRVRAACHTGGWGSSFEQPVGKRESQISMNHRAIPWAFICPGATVPAAID